MWIVGSWCTCCVNWALWALQRALLLLQTACLLNKKMTLTAPFNSSRDAGRVAVQGSLVATKLQLWLERSGLWLCMSVYSSAA